MVCPQVELSDKWTSWIKSCSGCYDNRDYDFQLSMCTAVCPAECMVRWDNQCEACITPCVCLLQPVVSVPVLCHTLIWAWSEITYIAQLCLHVTSSIPQCWYGLYAQTWRAGKACQIWYYYFYAWGQNGTFEITSFWAAKYYTDHIYYSPLVLWGQ